MTLRTLPLRQLGSDPEGHSSQTVLTEAREGLAEADERRSSVPSIERGVL